LSITICLPPSLSWGLWFLNFLVLFIVFVIIIITLTIRYNLRNVGKILSIGSLVLFPTMLAILLAILLLRFGFRRNFLYDIFEFSFLKK